MFRFTTIKDYHAALQVNQLSCAQVVDFYLSQIQKHSDLHSFIEVFSEEAMQRALDLDALRAQGKPLGKLHGVVVGIKDVLCYKDHQVSAAAET